MTNDTRNRTDTNETCDVLVGGQVFTIDRDLYIRRSAVLRKAIKKANKKAKTQQSSSSTPAPISFKDSKDWDPGAFSMYKRFVEAGIVDPDEPKDLITSLIRIYELAWQLEDFTASNSCIDRIIPAIQNDAKAPSVEHVAQVFGPLSLYHSQLRDLLVDFQIHDPRSMEVMNYIAGEGDDDEAVFVFLKNVTWEYEAIAERKGERGKAGEANDAFRNKPGDRDICHYYHQHNSDHQNLECYGVGSKGADEDIEEARRVSEEMREGSEEVGEGSEEMGEESEEVEEGSEDSEEGSEDSREQSEEP